MDTDFLIDIVYHRNIRYTNDIFTSRYILIIRGTVDGKEIRFIQIRL